MKAKQWLAIAVLTLFIVSVVPVAADEGTDESTDEATKTAREEAKAARAAAVEDAKEKREEIKEKAKETREKIKEARKELKEARKEFQDARKKLADDKDKLKACKGKDTEDCKDLRKGAKAAARTALLRAADQVLEHLEKLKENIQKSQMPDDIKAAMTANIDSRIAEVEKAREAAEALPEDATQDELKDAAKTIRDAWKDTRATLKHGVGRLMNEKIHGVIVRAEKLQEKLDRTLAKLKEKGVDTGAADARIAEFKTHIDEAKAQYDKAKELYAKAATPGEIDELMKEANVFMKEAQKHLKLAHESLKDIVKALRGELKETREKKAEKEVEKEEEAEEETEEEKAKQELKEEVSPGVVFKRELEGAATADMQSIVDKLVPLVKALQPDVKLEVKRDEGKVESKIEGSVTDDVRALFDDLVKLVQAAAEDVEIELKLETEEEAEEAQETPAVNQTQPPVNETAPSNETNATA